MPYGSGCGASLGVVAGQTAKVGNLQFGMELQGKANHPALLSAGFSATQLLGAVPLPIDLGILFPAMTGCGWQTSMDLLGSGVLTASGGATFAFPIPSDPALAGLAFFNQGLVFPPSVTPLSSNGLMLRIAP